MRIAIVCGGEGFHLHDLLRAAEAARLSAVTHDFQSFESWMPGGALAGSLTECQGAIIRTMPHGTLEQVVFRMDLLHALAESGVTVLNTPRALETCVDKYLTNVRLARAGLPVPRTWIGQRAAEAQNAFATLGDSVVKPLFGSEGRGMIRVSEPEMASRVFSAIEALGAVIYLQEFIPHPGWDFRLFVLAGEVIAAMRRVSSGDWRTNISRGARAENYLPTKEECQLAVAAAQATGAAIAGVDLLPGPDGSRYVIEVNAVPGWQALARVSEKDIARQILDYLVSQCRK